MLVRKSPLKPGLAQRVAGELSRTARDACLLPAFDPESQDFITLLALSAPYNSEGSASSHPCPALALTDGLRATGRASWKPDACRDILGMPATQPPRVPRGQLRRRPAVTIRHAAGARRQHQIMSLALGGLFRCGIARLPAIPFRLTTINGGPCSDQKRSTYSCSAQVFSEADKVTQLSGLHDTCRRTVLPGVTGNLTFNISAAAPVTTAPNERPAVPLPPTAPLSVCPRSNSAAHSAPNETAPRVSYGCSCAVTGGTVLRPDFRRRITASRSRTSLWKRAVL
ncbi:hypothetical protein HPB48_002005 [Haemaphysalis longicornis]|uniref:Uncharacterized protein n=1 Tax=Haemaphysalis longicornis TaxID=44386 RepID=A0A9J6FSW5_HAELO|nr:hypothetical protein HPB48_002005 [Haemaphysalis longicornis]